MGQVFLALVWHQHQPYYKDLVTGQSSLPWVRLHGIKDYVGMAALLAEVPELRQTINFTPSLLVQIEDYLKGGSDRFLDATKIPADGLNEADAKFILDHFFMANWQNMIHVHPRYGELLAKRSPGRKSVDRVWKRFTADELRDLQVWASLAWFHPTVIERDKELAGLIAKGSNYTEADKAVVIAKQMELLGSIVPVHRQLQEAGQLELTTTPFYHPILPLLWDIRLANVALPRMIVPQLRSSFRGDVAVQVGRAVECHRERFGRPPKGMWPSEGSVCAQIIPTLAAAGIQWIATDEEILGLSTGVYFDRDPSNDVLSPDKLYQPYRIQADGAEINAMFRDHLISDLIGFKYQWMPPGDAVGDLIGRLDRIRHKQPNRDHLVTVILDGENAWEGYPNCGVEFLRGLYRAMVSQPWLRTVRVSDYLEERPPTSRIEHLFAGSWISHNFATWVGHQEKNLGWEYLDRTRSFLERETAKQKAAGSDGLAAAWEELYIAEGSDWFWWYGDDHFSGNDEEFDRLFREHLKNVYRLAGAEPPDFLNNAIIKVGRPAVYTSPKTFLTVKLDGRATSYFEWASAGHYGHARDSGTMQKASGNILSDVYFGFDQETFYMRFDLAQSPAEHGAPSPETRLERRGLATPVDRRQLWAGLELTVSFARGTDAELVLSGLGEEHPTMTLVRPSQTPARKTLDSIRLDQILELAVKFEDLGVKPDDETEFAVEVSREGATIQRAPENTVIALKVPTPDFERQMWQV